MPKSDRLFRLLQLLRGHRHPVTAADLAAKLEVSRRTLYRDIDALRAAGARIEGEAGLGYQMIEDVALPPQTLTRLEVEALSVGLSEVRYRGDPALAAAAEDAMAKISATLTDTRKREVLHTVSQVYRFTHHESAQVDVTTIREACWSETALDLVYVDLKGVRTERRVYPLAVLYFEHAVMLLVYCCLRNDYRTFHLTGIQSSSLTTHSFRPRRVPMLNAYVSDLRAKLQARGDDMTMH